MIKNKQSVIFLYLILLLQKMNANHIDVNSPYGSISWTVAIPSDTNKPSGSGKGVTYSDSIFTISGLGQMNFSGSYPAYFYMTIPKTTSISGLSSFNFYILQYNVEDHFGRNDHDEVTGSLAIPNLSNKNFFAPITMDFSSILSDNKINLSYHSSSSNTDSSNMFFYDSGTPQIVPYVVQKTYTFSSSNKYTVYTLNAKTALDIITKTKSNAQWYCSDALVIDSTGNWIDQSKKLLNTTITTSSWWQLSLSSPLNGLNTTLYFTDPNTFLPLHSKEITSLATNVAFFVDQAPVSSLIPLSLSNNGLVFTLNSSSSSSYYYSASAGYNSVNIISYPSTVSDVLKNKAFDEKKIQFLSASNLPDASLKIGSLIIGSFLKKGVYKGLPVFTTKDKINESVYLHPNGFLGNLSTGEYLYLDWQQVTLSTVTSQSDQTEWTTPYQLKDAKGINVTQTNPLIVQVVNEDSDPSKSKDLPTYKPNSAINFTTRYLTTPLTLSALDDQYNCLNYLYVSQDNNNSTLTLNYSLPSAGANIYCYYWDNDSCFSFKTSDLTGKYSQFFNNNNNFTFVNDADHADPNQSILKINKNGSISVICTDTTNPNHSYFTLNPSNLPPINSSISSSSSVASPTTTNHQITIQNSTTYTLYMRTYKIIDGSVDLTYKIAASSGSAIVDYDPTNDQCLEYTFVDSSNNPKYSGTVPTSSITSISNIVFSQSSTSSTVIVGTTDVLADPILLVATSLPIGSDPIPPTPGPTPPPTPSASVTQSITNNFSNYILQVQAYNNGSLVTSLNIAPNANPQPRDFTYTPSAVTDILFTLTDTSTSQNIIGKVDAVLSTVTQLQTSGTIATTSPMTLTITPSSGSLTTLNFNVNQTVNNSSSYTLNMQARDANGNPVGSLGSFGPNTTGSQFSYAPSAVNDILFTLINQSMNAIKATDITINPTDTYITATDSANNRQPGYQYPKGTYNGADVFILIAPNQNYTLGTMLGTISSTELAILKQNSNLSTNVKSAFGDDSNYIAKGGFVYSTSSSIVGSVDAVLSTVTQLGTSGTITDNTTSSSMTLTITPSLGSPTTLNFNTPSSGSVTQSITNNSSSYTLNMQARDANGNPVGSLGSFGPNTTNSKFSYAPSSVNDILFTLTDTSNNIVGTVDAVLSTVTQLGTSGTITDNTTSSPMTLTITPSLGSPTTLNFNTPTPPPTPGSTWIPYYFNNPTKGLLELDLAYPYDSAGQTYPAGTFSIGGTTYSIVLQADTKPCPFPSVGNTIAAPIGLIYGQPYQDLLSVYANQISNEELPSNSVSGSLYAIAPYFAAPQKLSVDLNTTVSSPIGQFAGGLIDNESIGIVPASVLQKYILELAELKAIGLISDNLGSKDYTQLKTSFPTYAALLGSDSEGYVYALDDLQNIILQNTIITK